MAMDLKYWYKYEEGEIIWVLSLANVVYYC
jgi:hypothetical protein